MIINVNEDSINKNNSSFEDSFVLKGLQRQKVGFLIGPPDSGKGHLALAISYELATSIPILNVHPDMERSFKTLYWAHEDGAATLMTRIKTHIQNVSKGFRQRILDNIDIFELSDSEIQNVLQRNSNFVESIVSQVKNYDLLIIDTLRSAFFVSDDVKEDALIGSILKQIAIKADVAVLCIHHPTKAVGRGQENINSLAGSGFSITQADARYALYLDKVKGKSRLSHIKRNNLNEFDTFDGVSIEWSDDGIPYFDKSMISALLNNSKTAKKKVLVPKKIVYDACKISEESIQMAKKKQEDEKFIFSDIKNKIKNKI